MEDKNWSKSWLTLQGPRFAKPETLMAVVLLVNSNALT